MPQNDGRRVGRLGDLVDERAEEGCLGLVALEDVSFVLKAPVAPNALDDALLAASVSTSEIVSRRRRIDATRTCLARYTAPSSAALCSSLTMV
jgi:hypothetical protein